MLVILLALALDYWGEPANRWHPVVWLGHYLTWLKQQQERYENPQLLMLIGALGLGLGMVGLFLLLLLMSYFLTFVPLYARAILSAIVLTTSFSLQGLARAAHSVYLPLQANDLPQARQMLGYHMVSRNTSQLEPHEVAGAAVESVAENFSDSVIAPLFYFTLGEICGGYGLVLAWLYRFVNTADAILGYRKGKLEHLGKAAARLDDVLNIVPARASALLLCLTAPLVGANVQQAWRGMWRDARLTPSPNAGWTMATVAGGWHICLDKRQTYTLNAEGDAPQTTHIPATVTWMRWASGLGVLVFITLSLMG